MTDNVINIAEATRELKPKRPDFVYECAECTGQLFYLHNDGTIECRSCKRVRESIQWDYRNGMRS
jgi:hypothetical protein